MKKLLGKSIWTLLFILGACVVLAQDVSYDPTAKVPLDPKVIYGRLDNGLTYYIRENKKPEKRAELYLVVNAGAVQEDADQNGLAHFTEHMAFNGTKNFQKKEILDYLQSIGMKFGPEINAFTSSEETNYMLQAVPTDDPKKVDTALMVLKDWAANVAFEDEEIDNERGVLHEEWRTRRGAMFRMMIEANKVLYKGSKYADHDVIGDINLIDTFPHSAIKRFYNDWYRPDLEAIVAVGDFDAREMEKKISDMFSDIPARENPREKESYEIPDQDETLITIQTDKESPYSIVQIYYKHPPDKEKNMAYYRKGMVMGLFNDMLNKRLEELLQSDNPPFVYGYSGFTELTRTKDAFIAFAMAKNNEMDRAIDALLTEIRRVKEYGFTETEFDRTKLEIMTGLEQQYAERDKQENNRYVWSYYSHFLNDEPAPGIEFRYDFYRDMLPGVSLEEVNQLADDYITGENEVVVLMAPEKEDVIVPTREEVNDIMATVAGATLTPYVDRVSDKPLVGEEPSPGKVASKTKDKDLGTIEWVLGNGIKVVMKPTDFKDDEIRMTAFSPGGTSLCDLDDLYSGNFATSIIGESGVGDFDKTELEKKLAGKIVSVYPDISGTYEGFGGRCSPKDFETMMQLVYLYFTQPRMDEVAYNGFINRMKSILVNKEANPSSTLWDTVTVTMANYHPRARPLTVETLDEVKLNRARSIYRERFGDPSSFTFYFVGNIDPDEARPVLEKYLGGLPKVTREESWRDNGIRPPVGKINKVLYRNMKVPKSTVYISYTGTGDYDDFQDRLDLTALCDILDIRYVETVREEQGGTYGVSVRDDFEKYPYENYSVAIVFDCDPENATKLKGIIYDEIEKLKEKGPSEKDLHSVVENYLKTHQEHLKENRYWLNFLSDKDFYKTGTSSLMKYDDYVKNLSVDKLRDAASEFFGDNVVEIILMPENLDDNVKNPMIEKAE